MTKYPSGTPIEIVGRLGDSGSPGMCIMSDVDRLINTAPVLYKDCRVIPTEAMLEAAVNAIGWEGNKPKFFELVFDGTPPALNVGQKVRVVL